MKVRFVGNHVCGENQRVGSLAVQKYCGWTKSCTTQKGNTCKQVVSHGSKCYRTSIHSSANGWSPNSLRLRVLPSFGQDAWSIPGAWMSMPKGRRSCRPSGTWMLCTSAFGQVRRVWGFLTALWLDWPFNFGRWAVSQILIINSGCSAPKSHEPH